MILNEFFNLPQVFEKDMAEDQSQYTDMTVAQQVFKDNPNIDHEDDILNAAFPYVVELVGSRKRANYMFNYDEDFPSDLIGAYRYLQRDQHDVGLEEGTGQDSKSWMASIRQQHPDVKFIQAKMPGAPIIALVNGKPVAQFDTKKSVEEDGALDKFRSRIGTQGNIQRQNQRHQDWMDAHHQSSLDRMTNHRDAMNRLSNAGVDDTIARQEIRRERMKKDDDDWDKTFDVMRDRLNRYQWSSQKDNAEQGVDEGIFGSRPSPVLPMVDKIAKVAGGLTPQNVETGKQIIQANARDITRMLSPQAKAGVDVIEGTRERLSNLHDKIRKEKDLPDPKEYLKIAQQKKKEIADLKAQDKKEVGEGKGDYVPPKEADYGDKYQAMVKRVGEKARAQEKARQQQQPKAPVRESRLALLKQIIQS